MWKRRIGSRNKNKKQNTHRRGKVSLEYVIFSLSSLVSKTSISISSWGRMGVISVSCKSAGLLLPPSTFSASIIALHSLDRFLGQRLASFSDPWRRSPPRAPLFSIDPNTHMLCEAADLSPSRGSWPVIWQRLTIAGGDWVPGPNRWTNQQAED